MSNDLKNAAIAWAIGCVALYALGKVAPNVKGALMSASGMTNALPAGTVAVQIGTPQILPGSVTVG